MNNKELPEHILSSFRSICGETNVLTETSDRQVYGYDNSRQQAMPSVVLLPSSHQQVVDITRICYQHGLALIARGRGTGTTGATVPICNDVVLSTENMTHVLHIDKANRCATVSPGITNQALQDAAAKEGFFWPPDPTSAAFCSIGGNLAYNSAGPRAVKYGTPRENTLALTTVTGTGETLRTGTHTSKGVVGYDLTRLIIGSEGTLGIITEAVLKLTPIAERRQTLQAIYQDIHSAAQAVSDIMAQPQTPYALEFIDSAAIEMIRDHSEAELPDNAGAMLMIEADGPEAAITSIVESIITAAKNDGLVSITPASTPAEARALWATRKALSPALRKIAPKKINEDVVVPVSNIPALIEGLEKLSTLHQIKIVNFGHAGNGNIHVNLLVNPDDPQEMQRAQTCLQAVFDLVLALKGSLSGEHGVGLEKRDYISQELDPTSLSLMHQIKTCFDPKNILNPHKTLPPI